MADEAGANNYEILGKLAEGGMTEIFLARAQGASEVERIVVLKRLKRSVTSQVDVVKQFLDEARLAAQLQHPNVAQVYEVGKLGGSYFFAMELIHGETLHGLMLHARTKRIQIPVRAVLTIAAAASSGLHHAHERRSTAGKQLSVVHGDVSPSNLMISQEGIVKIVDFGVAKAGEVAQSKVSPYSSPEQCVGGRLDRRSDLFSLGIVLWELLTLDSLYERGSADEIKQAVEHETPTPPSTRRYDVPAELDAIVIKLLAKDPAQRFQDADDLLTTIEALAQKLGILLSTADLSRMMRLWFGATPTPAIDAAVNALEPVVVSAEAVPSDLVIPHARTTTVDRLLDSVRDAATIIAAQATGASLTPPPMEKTTVPIELMDQQPNENFEQVRDRILARARQRKETLRNQLAIVGPAPVASSETATQPIGLAPSVVGDDRQTRGTPPPISGDDRHTRDTQPAVIGSDDRHTRSTQPAPLEVIAAAARRTGNTQPPIVEPVRQASTTQPPPNGPEPVRQPARNTQPPPNGPEPVRQPARNTQPPPNGPEPRRTGSTQPPNPAQRTPTWPLPDPSNGARPATGNGASLPTLISAEPSGEVIVGRAKTGEQPVVRAPVEEPAAGPAPAAAPAAGVLPLRAANDQIDIHRPPDRDSEPDLSTSASGRTKTATGEIRAGSIRTKTATGEIAVPEAAAQAALDTMLEEEDEAPPEPRERTKSASGEISSKRTRAKSDADKREAPPASSSHLARDRNAPAIVTRSSTTEESSSRRWLIPTVLLVGLAIAGLMYLKGRRSNGDEPQPRTEPDRAAMVTADAAEVAQAVEPVTIDAADQAHSGVPIGAGGGNTTGVDDKTPGSAGAKSADEKHPGAADVQAGGTKTAGEKASAKTTGEKASGEKASAKTTEEKVSAKTSGEKASAKTTDDKTGEKASVKAAGEKATGMKATNATGDKTMGEKATKTTGEKSTGDKAMGEKATKTTGEKSTGDKATKTTGEKSTGDKATKTTGEKSTGDKATKTSGEKATGDTSTDTKAQAKTLEELFQAGDFAKASTACTKTIVFTPDKLKMCAIAACQTKNTVLARRWINAVEKASRPSLIATCKTLGVEVEQAAPPSESAPAPAPSNP